jgi:hypothetical protein
MPGNSSAGVEYRKLAMDPVTRVVGKTTHTFRRNRVLVPVELISGIAKDLTLDAITAAYPSIDRCKIGRPNVDVLPLVELTVSSADIESRNGMFFDHVKIHSKTLSFLTGPREVFLSFDVWEDDNSGKEPQLQKFIAFLPYMQLEAQVSFSVKSTKFNISSIDIEKLKITSLWVDLNGSGGVGYVSRNDLRNLALNAAVTVRSSFIVEDPANFDQGFAKRRNGN